MSVPRRAQIPVLEGVPWRIGANPDLGPLQGPAQEVVDHAIFPSADGRWHLWACIRRTRVGRLLYRWEGPSLETPDWEARGVALRVDRGAGESIDDRGGEEWIQAPHVTRWGGTYWMFYGGHNTETGECQICLATSPDGRTFTRHRDARGYSRVFVGPGEARDPMILRAGEQYICYYTGHDTGRPEPCKIYARTSEDLLHWSDYRAVCWGGSGGDGPWSAECPFVVARDGLYYLLRTSRYAPPALTHVYCSEDPLDFGPGTDEKKIGTLQVAAPEVILADGQTYISTVEDLQGGVQLARLGWA